MPIASVVGATADASGGVPVAFSTVGTVLVVQAVEASAAGTVYVLERVSDGAKASVEVSGQLVGAASTAVGTAVTVSAIAAGVVLSAAGAVIAFVPNEIGKALLHNERVSR